MCLQGLHLIKTVVDLKGMKRFKKQSEDTFSSDNLRGGINNNNASHVKDVFRKMTNTTAYARQFGEKPKDKQDFNVLREKQFAKLPMSQILQPNVIQILNRWLMINDQDKFTGRIYYTVREMFTTIKNQLHDVPTSQEHHAAHVELKA